MYRRSSVNNWVTPNTAKNTRKSSIAVPPSGGNLFRTKSTMDVRPSSVYRGPRSSSVDRKWAFSTGGGNQSVQSVGRFSMPYTGSNKPIKDPRPISDKSFQRKMIQKLHGFCVANGCQGITEKQLRSPSHVDFIGLFTFLYGFIDEDYEYQNKPIDVEFPELLRQLGYPFPLNGSTWRTFNAPHAWPTVLAAVHWLMEVVQFGMEFSFENVLFPASENDFLSPLAQRSREPRSYVVYQYYCEYFKLLQAGSDNYNEIDQNLADTLGVDGNTAARIEELKSENEQLKEESEALESKLAQVDIVQKSVASKNKDIARLEEYVLKMGDYLTEQKQAMEDLKEKQRAVDEDVCNIKVDIDKKKAIIASQAVKPADVELMVSTKVELKKRIASYSNEMHEAEKVAGQHQMYVARKKDILEAKAAEFTEKATRLVRAMPSLRSQAGEFTDISPFVPQFLESVRDHISPWIKNVRESLMEEMESIGSSITDNRDQIACLKGQLNELELEDQALQEKIKQYDDELQCYETNMNCEYKEVRKECDALEREYENALRARTAAGEERAAKEKLLEELNKELEEKRIQYATLEDQWETTLRKMMELIKEQTKDFSQRKENAMEKLKRMKERASKPS